MSSRLLVSTATTRSGLVGAITRWLLVCALALGVISTGGLRAGAADLSFTDVPTTHPFHSEILWLADQGITRGYADGTFRPSDAVARDAMAAFLYRMQGSPDFTPPATSPFSDVPTTYKFYKEVTWLANTGVTTGYADGTFRPADPVNRDAMAAYLYRISGNPTFTPPSTSPFKDVPKTFKFYKEITWLANEGITTGYADGTFRPGSAVNRDAMAAYMFRFLNTTVSSVAPATGPFEGGTTVTVTGTNFTNVTAVTFGDVAGTNVSVKSPTKLTVTSPVAAAQGVVDVRVTGVKGTSPITPKDQFTYDAQRIPTITRISPNSGPEAGGTTVTLTGIHLTGATQVTFGGVAGTNLVKVSDTQVNVTVPAGTGTADVVVTSALGTSLTSPAAQFTYLSATSLVPTITGISPAIGTPTGGTQVTISGTNFTGASSLVFGTKTATFQVVNATTVRATTPAGTAGQVVDVRLTTPNGTSYLAPSATYEYQAAAVTAPVLANISPANGDLFGGTVVTINGSGLGSATGVMFGTRPGTEIEIVSGTQLRVKTPEGASVATVNVTVTNPGGTSATTTAARFTYDKPPAPTVTAVAPATGPMLGGTTVTITGTDFTGATSVTFDGKTAASFTVTSDTTITAVTPWNTRVGKYPVIVRTPGGSSANTPASQFNYEVPPAPVVTSVAPTSGPLAGGTQVTITGSNLFASRVTFGGVAGTGLTVVSPTELKVTAPMGRLNEAVPVQVTTPGGTASDAITFTYQTPPAPSISTITPNSGLLAGGATVTIDGSNLAGTSQVTFGGVPSTSVTVTSNTQVRALVPAGTNPGTVPVVATTPGGTSNNTKTFTYLPPPTIAALNPANGPITGGTSVTITGTNFTGATAVKFGNVAATSFTVNSATKITAVAPAVPQSAEVAVTVTTPNGISMASVASTYTYTSAVPDIVSIDPTSGHITGGAVVTITGTGFLGTTGVTFDGKPSIPYEVVSDTVIKATVPVTTKAATVPLKVTKPGNVFDTINFDYVVPPPPVIATITPASGPLAGGNIVTVTGQYLRGATAVDFDGRAGTSVIVVSDTELTVKVPMGALDVDVPVQVTTPGGTSTITPEAQYHYQTPVQPVVTEVLPGAGPVAGLVTITLKGTDFAGASKVTFGTIEGTSINVVSNTELKVRTPASTVGTVDVKVTTPGGVSDASPAAKYTFEPAPVISAMSPNHGFLRGGDTITITGANLANVNKVTIDGASVSTITPVSATELTIVTPKGARPGGFPLIVESPSGKSAPATFTYDTPPVPVITTIQPATGPLNGGNSVTITGEWFTGQDTNVLFTDALGSYYPKNRTVVSDTVITLTAPFGDAVGPASVQVVAPGGVSAPKTYTFQMPPPPVVNTLTKPVGSLAGGESVRIDGQYFAGTTQVMFGSTPATNVTVNSSNPNQLIVTAPAAQTPGLVDVVVTTPGGTSQTGAGSKYTYQAFPVASSISPASGPLLGGTRVTINGTNLQGTTKVTFGGVQGTQITQISSTQLIVTAPRSQTPGAAEVRVETPGGISVDGPSFVYGDDLRPEITAISPPTGPLAGGTSVTLTGTNFTGTTKVVFGNVQAPSFAIVSATELTVIAPMGVSPAAVDVKVTNPYGTSAGGVKFTYTPPTAAPVVTAVNPPSGQMAGGEKITILGQNLEGSTVVKFGTATGKSVKVLSPTQLEVTAPMGLDGAVTVDVLVTNPAGTSVVATAARYTYQVPALPAVTELAPPAGPLEGRSVQVKGNNLAGASKVLVGTLEVTPTSVTDTTLTVAVPASATAGTVDIRVVTPGGTSSAVPQSVFTYQNPPTVATISPDAGPVAGGITVTITGTGLSNTTAVTFAGRSATAISVVSDSQITMTLPANPTPVSATVVVTTAGGKATVQNGFNYG